MLASEGWQLMEQQNTSIKTHMVRSSIVFSPYFAIFILIACIPNLAFGASTFIHVDATRSSYIGDSEDYRSSDVSIDTTVRPEIANSISINSDLWRILIAPVDGSQLVPDNYELTNDVFLTHTFPLLDVAWRTSGCSSSEGRFVIHEVEYDASNNITKFAMDFEFACFDSLALGLEAHYIDGQIRFNSELPEILERPNSAAGRDDIKDEGSVIVLNGSLSSPGTTEITDYSWRQVSGTTINIQNSNNAQATFIAPNVPLGGDDIVVELLVTNASGFTDTDLITIKVQDIYDPHTFVYIHNAGAYLPSSSDFYIPENYGKFKTTNNSYNSAVIVSSIKDVRVDFSELAVGYYIDAEKPPYDNPGAPRLRYDMSCFGVSNIKSGRYFVHEVEYDSNNEIVKLAVDFIDYCSSVHYGAIRYNSSYPLARNKPYAVAGSDQTIFEKTQGVLNGTYSDSGSDIVKGNLDKIISYKWEQISGTPAQISDVNSSAATFIAPTVVSGEETLTFQLTVTDAEGLTDVDQVDIIVQSTDIARNFMTIHDFKGMNRLFTEKNSEFELTHLNDFVNLNVWDAGVRLRTGDSSYFRIGSFSYIPDDPLEFPTIERVISLGADGYGCNRSYGVIDVLDFSKTPSDIIGASDTVTALAVDYVHYCEPTALANDIKTTGKIRINSIADGQVPIANAGQDIVVFEGENFLLDSTGSIDPDGQVIGYNWRQLSGQLQGVRYRNTLDVDVIPDITARPLPLGINETETVFELTIFDEDGFTSSDTVKVTILRKNQTPIANDDVITITENETVDIDIKINDIDPDGTIDQFFYGKHPIYGELIFTGFDTIRYIPNKDYTGNDSFTYAVLDNFGAYSDYATVNITVTPSVQTSPDTSPNNNGNTTNKQDSETSSGALSFHLLSLVLIYFLHTRIIIKHHSSIKKHF